MTRIALLQQVHTNESCVFIVVPMPTTSRSVPRPTVASSTQSPVPTKVTPVNKPCSGIGCTVMSVINIVFGGKWFTFFKQASFTSFFYSKALAIDLWYPAFYSSFPLLNRFSEWSNFQRNRFPCACMWCWRVPRPKSNSSIYPLHTYAPSPLRTIRPL